MPISDDTPARKLVIRRGVMTYIVDEAKYDTVVIMDDDPRSDTFGRSATYKALGYVPISAIEDGNEVPYVKREHVTAVPGREAEAAAQVALLTDADQKIPAAVIRASGAETAAQETTTTEPRRAPDAPRASKRAQDD